MPTQTIPMRGGIPTSRNVLAAATPHVAAPGTPDKFIKIPPQISMWGNAQFGDCVTAEEAFAKACHNPEIFLSDTEVTSWAGKYGYLNGASLGDVLKRMQYDGFVQGGYTYDNGSFYSVDWTNPTVLKSAIALGPVKIGVAADQLETAKNTTNGNTGWFGTGFKFDGKQDHCVALCGFGTISWLAQQIQAWALAQHPDILVSVPSGVDGAKQGYALFTWNSIGVIDEPSMLAITHEAWLRRPTTVPKVILGDTSPMTPAIAASGNLVFLAWKGDGNNELSVMCSADGGLTFGGKFISREQSTQAPALCAHNGNVFIAWQGIDNDQINIARVAVSGSTITGIVNKFVLHETSPKSPALASLGANMYLAWKGDSNDQLNVMVSPNNGDSWINKCILPATSPQAPALCGNLGILYIAWKGDGNDQINVAHINLDGNGISGLGTKLILPDTTPASPALTAIGNTLYLAWKGDSNDNLNIESSSNNGASFGNKITLGETSPEPPSLTLFNGALLIAWKGDSNDHLNVAKVQV
jgi:hypothetical protein